MTASLRVTRTLAALLLLPAAPLAAQAPAPPVPVTRSVSVDLAALARSRVRAGVDPITIGRFTIGAGLSYQHRGDTSNDSLYPLSRGVDDVIPCYEPFSGPSRCIYPIYPTPERYRAWSLDLAVRYYPSLLSFQNGATRLGVYVGEFVGYHWRTWSENYVSYYGGPYLLRPDTVIYPPDTTLVIDDPVYGTLRRTLQAFQPGAEIGVRLLPFGPLFIEVGGRFTLVTKEDPWRRTRPGDVESRLVVAVGLSK